MESSSTSQIAIKFLWMNLIPMFLFDYSTKGQASCKLRDRQKHDFSIHCIKVLRESIRMIDQSYLFFIVELSHEPPSPLKFVSDISHGMTLDFTGRHPSLRQQEDVLFQLYRSKIFTEFLSLNCFSRIVAGKPLWSDSNHALLFIFSLGVFYFENGLDIKRHFEKYPGRTSCPVIFHSERGIVLNLVSLQSPLFIPMVLQAHCRGGGQKKGGKS